MDMVYNDNISNYKTMKKGIIIAVVVLVLIAGYFVVTYNGLVSQSGAIDGQWAQVETQYQRRFDLIPGLVATVKGLFKQEQTVFGDIAAARTRYSGATSVNEKVAAANQIEGALARLLVIVENYPELRSSQAVITLMSQLEGTENRVSVERGRYNTVVQTYNIHVRSFSTSIAAALFGFSARNYFEADKSAATAPTVSF